jgi:hypothetical protein
MTLVVRGGTLVYGAFQEERVDECLGQVAAQLSLGDVVFFREEAGRATCGSVALEPAGCGEYVSLLRERERRDEATEQEGAFCFAECPRVRSIAIGVAVLC